MAFFDFTLTDLIAIAGLTITFLALAFQRSQTKGEAKQLAANASVEAARLAQQAKVEAVNLAERAQASRDNLIDEVRGRIVALETRQDIIWDFLIRRSKAELVTRGWGKIKSPLQLTTDAIDCLNHLLPKMLPVYEAIMTSTPDATERMMFITFEATFGDMLVEEVCIPFNMTSGACVVAAIEACKLATKGDKHADTPPTE